VISTTEERSVGIVIQYFAKPEVAAIQLTEGEIKVGDTLRFKGATTNFEQKIESMQIDRVPVQGAKAGQSVGIKVKERVRQHDKVFVVV
jgi:translation initiation factor IF-2